MDHIKEFLLSILKYILYFILGISIFVFIDQKVLDLGKALPQYLPVLPPAAIEKIDQYSDLIANELSKKFKKTESTEKQSRIEEIKKAEQPVKKEAPKKIVSKPKPVKEKIITKKKPAQKKEIVYEKN